jgi:uncharacterized membrane protein
MAINFLPITPSKAASSTAPSASVPSRSFMPRRQFPLVGMHFTGVLWIALLLARAGLSAVRDLAGCLLFAVWAAWRVSSRNAASADITVAGSSAAVVAEFDAACRA